MPAGPVPFRDMYDANVRPVMALAVALTGDRASAEDLVQEAFTRAYRDWERVGRYDRPGAWVRRVVINLSHSRWRRLRSEARALRRLDPEVSVEMADPAPDVWAAVRRLPHRQAAAITLHYVEDLSVAQIAAVTGVAEGTTKSDLHRARTRLAEMLDQEWLS